MASLLSSVRSGLGRLWLAGRVPTPPPKPFAEMGVAGTAVWGGYVQVKEKSPDWVGRQKYVTSTELAVNTAIVSAGVHYFLNLVAYPKWNIRPSDDDDEEAIALAEFVENVFSHMTSPWYKIVRRAAMYRFHGFGIQEWTALKRKDGLIGFKDIEARPQHTIEQWDVDVDGTVLGMWQRSPQTGQLLGIPRKKVLYLVEDTLTDSPEGMGMFRHMADSYNRLKQLQELEIRAYERDLRGIPIGRAPISRINQAVSQNIITSADAQQMINDMRAMVQLQVKQSDTGLVLDSIPYFSQAADGEQVSAVPQWGFDLLSGAGVGYGEIASAIDRVQREMARIMGIEHLMMGDVGGNRSLAEDKSRNLYLIANSVLKYIVSQADKDILNVLWKLNGFPMSKKPLIKAEDVTFKNADAITSALGKLAQAGATLAPNDPVVNSVREILGVDLIPKEIIEQQKLQAMQPTMPGGIPLPPGFPPGLANGPGGGISGPKGGGPSGGGPGGQAKQKPQPLLPNHGEEKEKKPAKKSANGFDKGYPEYDPDEPRDVAGRWSGGEGGRDPDLDMSRSARMARARAQGFDTSRILYHGTAAEFDEFKPSGPKEGMGPGVYLAPSRKGAEIHSGMATRAMSGGGDTRMLEVYIRAPKVFLWDGDDMAGTIARARQVAPDIDVGRDRYTIRNAAAFSMALRSKGYHAIENRIKRGDLYHQIIVFDPSNIRLINAAFDPKYDGSPKFMKGYPEYDDDQPRDGAGRWSGGGSPPAAFSGATQLRTPSNDVIKAVEKYSRSGRMINHVLRNTKGDLSKLDADKADLVRKVDTYLESFEAPRDLTLYRGVTPGHDSKFISGMTSGDQFTDYGFLSTSTKQSNAAEFTEGSDGSMLMEIIVPKGHKLAPLKGITESGWDFNEVLLPRGTKLRHTGSRKVGWIPGLRSTVHQFRVVSKVDKGNPEYRPDQPRDEGGRWAGGGGSASTGHEAQQLYEHNFNAKASNYKTFLKTLTPQQRSAIRRATKRVDEAIARGERTTDKYFDNATGKWSPDRQRLHEEIIDYYLRDALKRGAVPNEGEQPTVIFMGGRAGAGKGHALKVFDMGFNPDNFLTINSDLIQEKLPGHDPELAALFHEEASQVSEELQRRARSLGINIIFDATMKTRSGIEARVDDYESDGYRMEGYFVHTAPHISAMRTVKRHNLGAGRFVPPSYTLNSTTNESSFDSVKSKFDKWAVFDNNGKTPKLVALGSKGKRIKRAKVKKVMWVPGMLLSKRRVHANGRAQV